MENTDIISLISKIRDKANKFITSEMEKNGVKGFATSHGDIIFALLKSERLTMKELSEKIDKDKSTITALVNKLIKEGYVEKNRDINDNRIVFVSLTQKGKNLEDIFNSISERLILTVYKDISDEEKESLLAQLIKIKDNL